MTNGVLRKHNASQPKENKRKQHKLANAIQAFDEGHYDQAEKLIHSLAQEPEYQVSACYMLGMIADKRDDPGKAHQYYQQGLESDPTAVAIWQQLASLALREQQFEQAISHFKQALHYDDANIQLYHQLANCYHQLQRHSEAADCYLMILSFEPLDRAAHAGIIKYFTECEIETTGHHLQQQILQCLAIDNISKEKLGYVLLQLIKLKYHIDEQSENAITLDLATIAADEFFISVLKQTLLIGRVFELMINRLRKEILLSAIENLNINADHLNLAVAIATQCAFNEYMLPYDEEEKTLLIMLQDVILQLLDNDQPDFNLLSGFVLLIALYQPLYELPCAKRLSEFDLSCWLPVCRELIQNALLDYFIELGLAQGIPSHGEFINQTTQQVRAQYEENPYPRWLNLAYCEPLPVNQVISQSAKKVTIPLNWQQRRLQLLVAGCGTGQHALQVAKIYDNVDVLAIDISRRSLSYGQKMAKRYGIKNVEFMHADILSLSSLDKRFDLIECGGVLHHMADPLAGWRVLRGLLKPKCFMHIALYSECARREIVLLRELIAKMGLQATRENIIKFRENIFSNSASVNSLSNLILAKDFNSISGCRDLLFHVQEHRFDLAEIAKMLNQLELNFIGFSSIKKRLRELYLKHYPNDSYCENLENWIMLEASESELVGELLNISMYEFWCQANT